MGPVKSQTGNLQTLERRPETEEPNSAPLRSGWRLRSWVGPIIAVTVLVLTPPARLSAQEAGLEFSGGYSFLDGEDLVSGYGLGWQAEGGWRTLRGPSLVVETSRHQSVQDVGFIDVEATVWSLVAGPRFRLKRQTFSPFAHILAGATQVGFVANTSGPIESTGADNAISTMLQVGGGIELPLSPRFGLKITMDYRRVIANHLSDQYRFSTGVVYRVAGS